MTKSTTARAVKSDVAKTPRRDAFHKIEGIHFGRCLDQVWGKGRLTLVELLEWPKARSNVIVMKEFMVPAPDFDKEERWPWPELKSVHVYAAIDVDDGGTWESLDLVLRQYEDKRKAGEAAQAI